MITFVLKLDPVAKQRPRFRFGSVRPYTPSETMRFESDFRLLSRMYRPEKPLDCPLSLTVVFYISKPKSVKRSFPAVKPDIDNLIKAVKDAGNNLFWKDDAVICRVEAEKHYAPEGRIEIKIEEMTCR